MDLCLDAKNRYNGAKLANGNPVQAATCTGSTTWIFASTPRIVTTAPSSRTATPSRPPRALEVRHGSLPRRQESLQRRQARERQPRPGRHVHWKYDMDLCLDAKNRYNGAKLANGNPVQAYTCEKGDNDNQNWKVI